MTEITHEALEALSKKALDARKAYDAHPDHDTLCALLEHEKRFGYALADLYRTGQLVPAQPSGDEVEAVARAIWQAGGCEERDWDYCTPQAEAAITALDAVRGKQ